MSLPVCVITGAGPGNGQSLAARFAAAGYQVALLARSAERVQAMADEIDGASGYACDVSSPEQVQATFAAVEKDLGPITTLLYNAGAGNFGNAEDITLEDFETDWRVNAFGLLLCARAVIPGMRRLGHGQIVVSGATASVKGSANFAGFAASKAAQHSLAQSLARQLGPEGIHVAIAIIDGVIESARTRDAMPDKSDEGFMDSDAIAESIFQITQQPRSAWTFQLDLRPYVEKW